MYAEWPGLFNLLRHKKSRLKTGIKKWRQQDSNLRPFTRQANALPAELCLHVLYDNTFRKNIQVQI